MRALIYGIGYRYEENRDNLYKKYDIAGLVDHDAKKQGKKVDGHIIMPPSSIAETDFDKIIVTPDFILRKGIQLANSFIEKYGVKAEKIEFLTGININALSMGTEIKHIDTGASSYIVMLDKLDTDDITNALRNGHYQCIETRLADMFAAHHGGGGIC